MEETRLRGQEVLEIRMYGMEGVREQQIRLEIFARAI